MKAIIQRKVNKRSILKKKETKNKREAVKLIKTKKYYNGSGTVQEK